MSSSLSLTPSRHVISLRSSGTLVTPVIRSTTLTIRDRRASNKVASDNNCQATNAIDVNKKLASTMAQHRALQNHRQTIHNGMNVYTFDFAGKTRFLPSSRYPAFKAWWAEMVDQHAKLKAAFLKHWPDVRANAAFALGDLFDRNEYPTADELERKFSIDLFESEVPEGDFRQALSTELANDLHNHYQNQFSRIVQDMLAEQTQQLASVMKSISHCCDLEVVTEPDGSQRTKRRKLYDATIQKALEMCDTFARLNPAGDPGLEQARADLSRVLADVPNVETLRESDSLRVKVKAGVDDILSRYSF